MGSATGLENHGAPGIISPMCAVKHCEKISRTGLVRHRSLMRTVVFCLSESSDSYRLNALSGHFGRAQPSGEQ